MTPTPLRMRSHVSCLYWQAHPDRLHVQLLRPILWLCVISCMWDGAVYLSMESESVLWPWSSIPQSTLGLCCIPCTVRVSDIHKGKVLKRVINITWYMFSEYLSLCSRKVPCGMIMSKNSNLNSLDYSLGMQQRKASHPLTEMLCIFPTSV